MPVLADRPGAGTTDPGHENPGGSQAPSSDHLAAELRRYERHGGDHVARYRWAAAGLRDARILDVGCGHGFGALLLAGSCREYVGIDVDRDAIDWASRVVGPAAPRASFRATSRVPADGPFDAVVAFEVVEHVPEPARLLGELRAAAAPGAPVFLSTPNGALSNGRPEWYMSPFHLTEFSAPQFEALVASSFGRGGEYFAQYRVDRLDWLPQALRRGLGGPRSPPRGADGSGAGSTPGALQQAHGWLRRIPSPAWLWRTSPLRPPLSEGLGYSHLLWTGRRPRESVA